MTNVLPGFTNVAVGKRRCVCVCVYVCIFVKLHITAQSSPLSYPINSHSVLLFCIRVTVVVNFKYIILYYRNAALRSPYPLILVSTPACTSRRRPISLRRGNSHALERHNAAAFSESRCRHNHNHASTHHLRVVHVHG